jgi:hypothetical protein
MAAAAVAKSSVRKWRDGSRRMTVSCGGRIASVIEIAFDCGARVHLRGEVSAKTLRQVIELLRSNLCRRAAGCGWRRVPPTCAKGSTAWRRKCRRSSGRIRSRVTVCFRGRRGDLLKLLW